ncbi:hypothetical protein M0L20_13650 [Spirosoma sp. RP8]|uniref:Uncharacterized protein n=1 Tax=Spirosoma liriopis TaxID=2937440 RepID=A0ABT0HM19_9BACT|nr:hypothetical protein [Spirosoma liriopis]MCK8492907.1 hypothetical protein [Spirosoma liriopis]
MQKLDSKKIEGIIKQLENAGKGAVRILNEMTDNSLKDSPMEKDPFSNLGLIVATLNRAKTIAAENAQYEGMDADQIAEVQAAAREAEKEALQLAVQEKLAARQPKEQEPTEEPEQTGDNAPQV